MEFFMEFCFRFRTTTNMYGLVWIMSYHHSCSTYRYKHYFSALWSSGLPGGTYYVRFKAYSILPMK